MSKIKLNTKKTKFKLKNIIFFFDNKRNQNIFSTLLILISCYLIIAFFSFCFNWKTDDNIVSNNDFLDVISNNNIENAIGGLGAYISNLLIKNSFGIFAFIIPFALLILAGATGYVIGGVLTLKISSKKNENVTTSICIWASIILLPLSLICITKSSELVYKFILYQNSL